MFQTIIYSPHNILKEHQDYLDWTVLPDRNCSTITTGILPVLIYDMMTNLCQHCVVETKNRRIVQQGPHFELSTEEFNCLELCGDVVSGLSQSLDTVNRFNIKTRQFSDKINIFGLPPTVQYMRDFIHRREVSFELAIVLKVYISARLLDFL
jgi:hypothetical protein